MGGAVCACFFVGWEEFFEAIDHGINHWLVSLIGKFLSCQGLVHQFKGIH